MRLHMGNKEAVDLSLQKRTHQGMPYNNHVRQLVLKRVDKTIQLMGAIRKLRDTQCELLLLRSCAGVSRLYFSMRIMRPSVIQQVHPYFDKHLFHCLQQLITGDGPGFGPLQQRIATLPLSDGGFGIYTMTDTNVYCFIASYAQTKTVQECILRNSGVVGSSPLFQAALDSYIQVCGSLTPFGSEVSATIS